MDSSQSVIIRCDVCGVRNRIPPHKIDLDATCGKCGSPLKPEPQPSPTATSLLLRCTECGAKNRLPGGKITIGAKCGKCGSPLETDDVLTTEPLMITDGNFEQKVLKSPLPFLLFAWAPWCPTCRTFIAVIESYAKVAAGKVRVGKLNVDANPMLSSKYNILSVPFIFIFDNGQLKESMPGSMQQHDIMIKMAHYI
jgi:thioredoxin 2